MVKHTFSGGALILADSDGGQPRKNQKVDCKISKKEELGEPATRGSIINLQQKALGQKAGPNHGFKKGYGGCNISIAIA
ncbi:hypothetical protein CR513_52932, partial [Mucuna pruriens]